MRPATKAVAVGAAAAIPVLGVLLYRKVGNLLDQAQVMQRSLTAEAHRQVEASAKTTVEQYLGEIYGLTPARIDRIGRIAAALPSF